MNPSARPPWTPAEEIEAARTYQELELRRWELVHELTSYEQRRADWPYSKFDPPTPARDVPQSWYDLDSHSYVVCKLLRTVSPEHQVRGTGLYEVSRAIVKIEEDAYLRNLGLLHLWSHRLQHMAGTSSLTRDDLMGVGFLGVKRALRGFDTERGLRLSTYMVQWIRQQMVRHIRDGSLTHNTARVHDRTKYVREVLQKAFRDGKPEPTYDEVVAGLPEGVKMTPEIYNAIRFLRVETWLDNPTGFDGASSGTLVDTIADTQEGLTEEMHCSDPETIQSIRALLSYVPERDRAVFQSRYPLDDSPALTLQEVGDLFGFTRERARQIEAKVKAWLLRNVELSKGSILSQPLLSYSPSLPLKKNRELPSKFKSSPLAA